MSVSEWGGDSGARVPGADVDTSGSAVVDPERSATESGHDDSGQLRAEIAAVLDASLAAVCATWKPSLARRAAADLEAAGFRVVSEDDTTVDRVARAMWHAFWDVAPEAGSNVLAKWTPVARAAVRALREGELP